AHVAFSKGFLSLRDGAPVRINRPLNTHAKRSSSGASRSASIVWRMTSVARTLVRRSDQWLHLKIFGQRTRVGIRPHLHCQMRRATPIAKAASGPECAIVVLRAQSYLPSREAFASVRADLCHV